MKKGAHVTRVTAFIMAETLEAGTAVREAVGNYLSVDTKAAACFVFRIRVAATDCVVANAVRTSGRGLDSGPCAQGPRG